MHFYCLKCGNSKRIVFSKWGWKLIQREKLRRPHVFILEFDDVTVKQPKTIGYEFFILHDIDNIDN